MTQTTGKGEGDEPGTYTEVEIIPPKTLNGKPSYTAITHRAKMQQDPPDILLTNYKMLDYLLLRPKDRDIWRFNQANPMLLQYLVLDELHTYDGAQGADVTCLLRRLKTRLAVPAQHLCVVGTSATIAGGDDEQTMDPIDRLCQFAESLFEEPIGNDCVFTEDRYKVEEIIRPAIDMAPYPDTTLLVPQEKESAPDYAQRVSGLLNGPVLPVSVDHPWLKKVHDFDRWREQIEKLNETSCWGLALGEWLRCHPLFHALLEITREQVATWNALLQQLSKVDFSFQCKELIDSGQKWC